MGQAMGRALCSEHHPGLDHGPAWSGLDVLRLGLLPRGRCIAPGRLVGARRRQALERAVRLCLKWSLIFAAGFSVAYIVAGPALINLLTDLPEVRETTLRYLPWMILSPLVSVWSFLYDGVYVGATRAREMRNIMLFSTFAVFLPAWYLLQFLGNDGLWLAFMLFLASRGIGMHVRYRKSVLASLPAAG